MRTALERTVEEAARASGRRAEQIDTGLEDVFIYLMGKAEDNVGGAGMSGRRGFSVARWWSIVLKEFTQLKRDRLTFAMIVGIPILQMALFGYAINTNPKHLDTAVIDAPIDTDITRSFHLAHAELVVLQIVEARCPTRQRGARRWRGGRCCL